MPSETTGVGSLRRNVGGGRTGEQRTKQLLPLQHSERPWGIVSRAFVISQRERMSASSLKIARAVRTQRRLQAPKCSARMQSRKGMRVCGKPMIQNAPEAQRGVYWCPSCKRYTDGSNGFPSTQVPQSTSDTYQVG